ncbi:DNA topology modulation protein FlaR [Cohnella sp.]|uniref:DNA topology modulation protein FlaR n=1 Tax=Cohnella sp. TaxID=1883426 RepID=UPI0035651C81
MPNPRIYVWPYQEDIINKNRSGKTTLARNLSSKHNIPYYELDNVMWKRHKTGDIRRTDEERDEYLDEIICSDRWIIEGKANYTPTIKMFIKMFEWNAGFEKQSKPMILSMFRQDNIKFLILKDNIMIDKYYSSLN